MAETKLGPLIDDDVVSLDGYRLFRRDRNTRGGGVALFINTCFRVKILATSTHLWIRKPGLPKYLFCEIAGHGVFPIFVAVVYRPPDAPFFEGTDFVPSLQLHLQSNSTKVILGDFNADQLSLMKHDARIVRSLCSDLGLQQVLYGPTHHTSDGDTLLDLRMIDNEDTLLSYWKTDVSFIDGHDLITATLRAVVPRQTLTSDICYRDFSALDVDEFTVHLMSSDWSIFGESAAPVVDLVSCLICHLGDAISAAVPVKTVKKDSKRKPWFTARIDRLVAIRDRLYRVYRRVRSRRALLEYRAARDRAHGEVESARQLFFGQRLKVLSDPGLIWKELRRLGVVPVDNVTQDFDPEVLNAYFAGVSFDPNELSVDVFLDSFLGEACAADKGFSFGPVTAEDVRSAILPFSSGAKGTDGIPKSIKNPSEAGDYRPIALLCFLSKVLERLASLQILEYLAERSILDPRQTGFRPFNSTQTALLRLTDDIRTGIDRRELTMLLLFDFSKAFDSVSHVRLLRKLVGYGFSAAAVRWIASYLSGRTQSTVGGASGMSSSRPLNRGVPQGSVLGPLLFLLFINDVAGGLGQGIQHLIYADDLQIYLSFSRADIEVATCVMSSAAKCIMDWAACNRLRLNVAKTKAIIFGSQFFINELYSLPNLSIDIDGASVSFDSSVRSLGVVLDSKLTWKEHVAGITRRVHSVMYRLRFFRTSTSQGLRKHLIETLVFPVVDYCCLVYAGLSEELSLRLQRLINMGIRYIFGMRWDEHITPYRLRLGWMLSGTRRKYFLGCQTFRALRLGEPVYLADLFVLSRGVRLVRGEVNRLLIKSFRTEAMRRSFQTSAAYFWNSLPSLIRDQPSLPAFKLALRAYLRDNP
ncbi:uncharacterized protein LOC107041750 [Diachasma alloeum]|uniref:uncharacterized protein LOC107041750 n=1 Tax=Diachasma alloeum TaxID=454923 RepID=UPI0007383262|nr:uncharacterized protein LOC107041750 [Diachasma alloeum]